MDFGERGLRQAAAQRPVERAHPRLEEKPVGRRDAVTAQHHASGLAGRCGGTFEPFGKPALDLRDLLAQGKNSLPRHGVNRHATQAFPRIVPVMFL